MRRPLAPATLATLAAVSFAAAPAAAQAPAAREQLRDLLDTGRYEEAAAAAAGNAALARARGRALVALGRLDEAEAAFRAAIAAGAPDAAGARADLGELLVARGRRDEAHGHFRELLALYRGGAGRLDADALTAVATAARHLGALDPGAFRDALRVYDEAIAADADAVEPRVLLGELFLEKYNAPDAGAALDRALALEPGHADALVARARLLEFTGEPGAAELARKALETNPRHAGAHVLLAGQALRAEAWERGQAAAEEALATNPASVPALAMLAASHWLRGDEAGFRRVAERAAAVDPRPAAVYAETAELAAHVRRYADAVELAARAVELDPGSWSARATLGLNQLRVGRMQEGRASLEKAFEGDPYHVWVKNTLDLLDTFAAYETTATPRFRLVIHGRESALLAPYVRAVADEAWDSLRARWGTEPPTPVRIELFPSHADFSVRTVGLTGLGALGVAFGPVIAMDSPAAREMGGFNWASTLWHELAHVFHLHVSRNRMPRWLGEGLAVWEQRRRDSAWGHGASLSFLLALKQGRLPPVSRLNEAFVRPAYPEQVVHGYYQASLVVEMVERRHGFDAVAGLLARYAAGARGTEPLNAALGMDADGVDRAFDAFLRDRFARELAALGDDAASAAGAGAAAAAAAALERARDRPGDFPARLAAGRLLLERGELDAARAHLEAARDLMPEYGGPDSPYLWLARVHLRAGDPAAAARALRRLVELGEEHEEPALQLAALLTEQGDAAGTAWALERALQVDPYDPDVHARLADALARLGRPADAVRERRAVVALDPPDRAGALYRLAAAQRAAGDDAAARATVLQSLELAPTYEPALELLLELRGQP